MSGVVSAGFPFVVKVEALPPLWRGSVVFGEAQYAIKPITIIAVYYV